VGLASHSNGVVMRGRLRTYSWSRVADPDLLLLHAPSMMVLVLRTFFSKAWHYLLPSTEHAFQGQTFFSHNLSTKRTHILQATWG